MKNAELDILVGDRLGFIRVEVVVLVLLELCLKHIGGDVTQVAVELQFTELMEKGAFFRIDRGLIRKLF